MPKLSQINFTVELDDKKMPEKIEWEATDAGFEGKKNCSALMISLWDKDEKSTLGIDLWTKEMLVDDMNIHFYQILTKMADTYLRATQNNDTAKMIEDFAQQFADKLNLIKKIDKERLS
ncbi:MAG: gliding motility protein GldC [Ignavibacteriaceae bacterium]